jgi:hypothetical protein
MILLERIIVFQVSALRLVFGAITPDDFQLIMFARIDFRYLIALCLRSIRSLDTSSPRSWALTASTVPDRPMYRNSFLIGFEALLLAGRTSHRPSVCAMLVNCLGREQKL